MSFAGAAGDDVVVGEDQAVGVEDDAGARGRPGAGHAGRGIGLGDALGDDRDDGRADGLDDVDDGGLSAGRCKRGGGAAGACVPGPAAAGACVGCVPEPAAVEVNTGGWVDAVLPRPAAFIARYVPPEARTAVARTALTTMPTPDERRAAGVFGAGVGGLGQGERGLAPGGGRGGGRRGEGGAEGTNGAGAAGRRSGWPVRSASRRRTVPRGAGAGRAGPAAAAARPRARCWGRTCGASSRPGRPHLWARMSTGCLVPTLAELSESSVIGRAALRFLIRIAAGGEARRIRPPGHPVRPETEEAAAGIVPAAASRSPEGSTGRRACPRP